jgi:hypothetical protein
MTTPRDRTFGERLIQAFTGINRALTRTQDDYVLVGAELPPIPEQKDKTMDDQPQLPLYDDPRARRDDPITSHEAADSVADPTPLQARIFELLSTRYPGGLTHEEIVVAYGGYVEAQGWPPATPQNIRSRVKELVRAGRIRKEDTPTGTTATGRRSYRWLPVTDPTEQRSLRIAVAEAERVAAERRAAAVEPMALDPEPGVSREHLRPLTEELARLTRAELLAQDMRSVDAETFEDPDALATALAKMGWHL